MSQVNPIPKGNGIWDEEQIAPRWCRTGQETLEEKKNLARSNTIEDTAVIFAVSRVFIIDFLLRHNGWAIMKSLSFQFLCVVRWWGHWLKVASVHGLHGAHGEWSRVWEHSPSPMGKSGLVLLPHTHPPTHCKSKHDLRTDHFLVTGVMSRCCGPDVCHTVVVEVFGLSLQIGFR